MKVDEEALKFGKIFGFADDEDEEPEETTVEK